MAVLLEALKTVGSNEDLISQLLFKLLLKSLWGKIEVSACTFILLTTLMLSLGLTSAKWYVKELDSLLCFHCHSSDFHLLFQLFLLPAEHTALTFS